MIKNVQLGFNLSNRVTDTLESSLILIYSGKHTSLCTLNVDRMPCWLNGWWKVDESQKQEVWIKSAVVEENCELGYHKIFIAYAKYFFEQI